jgi:hypothetical protein
MREEADMQRDLYSPAAFGAAALPVAFAGGSLAIVAFMIIAFAGIVIGYFTRRGSGINAHPYGKIYSGAPGARGRAEISGRDARRDDYWIRRRGCR